MDRSLRRSREAISQDLTTVPWKMFQFVFRDFSLVSIPLLAVDSLIDSTVKADSAADHATVGNLTSSVSICGTVSLTE